MPDCDELPYDRQNIFARILRGEAPSQTVYEDEWALAFHDIYPQAPVHVLVIPKQPYVSFADFCVKAPTREMDGFWRAVGAVARQLAVEECGYRLVVNTGRDAAQLVPHFHVHVLAGCVFDHTLVAEALTSSESSGTETRQPRLRQADNGRATR